MIIIQSSNLTIHNHYNYHLSPINSHNHFIQPNESKTDSSSPSPNQHHSLPSNPPNHNSPILIRSLEGQTWNLLLFHRGEHIQRTSFHVKSCQNPSSQFTIIPYLRPGNKPVYWNDPRRVCPDLPRIHP